jgi:uncharacterized membrane protein YgcG
VYDPSTAEQGIHAGAKVLHGVGFDRWVSKAGNPMLEVYFVVLQDLADSGDEGELTRRSFALTESAIQFWGRLCLAAGHTKPHDPEHDDDVVEHIIGKGPILATCKAREYQGESKIEPDGFKAYKGEPDPGWDEVIEAGRASFEKILAARKKKAGGGGGGSRASSEGSGGRASTGGGGRDNDDIPF